MDQGRLLLAIDQGSHASRAIVFDGAGDVRATAEAEIASDLPRDGWVEHDPDALIGATEDVVRSVARELGGDVALVDAAGFATQRSSIACWDRVTGAPLSPILSWRDRRAAEWLRRFEHREPEIHAITGLVLSPHYGASKLRWCLDHLPEVAAARDGGRLAFGPLSSYLVHRMCVERPLAADPANASRTQLWDRRSADWSDELLELYGVPRACLPESTPTRHAFGHVLVGDREVPVTVVTGDQSAALFGLGAPTPDVAYMNLGTGAFLQQVVDPPPESAPGLLSSVVYRDDARSISVLEGTVNGAGSALAWVAEERGIDPSTIEANSARWLETVEDPPLFLNGVGGLGAPFWVPDFPTRFVGEGDDAASVVAVMESVVFLLLVNLERFAEHAPRPTRLQVTGGLANVEPLCQRLADLSGLPVARPRVREATAKGLAWLIAGSDPDWAPEGDLLELRPRPNAALRARYGRWRDAMRAAIDGRG